MGVDIGMENPRTEPIAENAQTCGFVQVTEEVICEVWSELVPRPCETPTTESYAGMHLLQGLTKLATHGTLTISKEHLERLARREIRDKTVAEKIELVLRWFSRKTMYVSEPIRVEPEYDYPAAFCAHPYGMAGTPAHDFRGTGATPPFKNIA